MKRWRDLRKGPEQRQAVRDALRASDGNVRAAARLLGISRQYFHRILAEGAAWSLRVRDARRVDPVASVDTHDHGDTHRSDDAVARSRALSSTSGHPAPTFHDAGTVPAAREHEPKAATKKLIVDILEEDKHWLEDEAKRQQRELGLPRASMARVIQNLVAQERARRQPARVHRGTEAPEPENRKEEL